MTDKKRGGENTATEFLLFETKDGQLRVETRMQGETVWLTLTQMAALFAVDKSGISRHLKNIFASGELERAAVVANFATTASDGKTYQVEHFNLDVIISVGYRVNSLRGTQFRQWASKQLREYLIKGFAMDDERLKSGGGGSYFDEILARIRDIRSSEKMFWRKVLDIYATSIDYDPRAESSREFFQVIQNKMHWAAHGQTAAEVIFNRVSDALPNMGLTNWVGDTLRKKEVEVAKNYLDADELNLLNRIVTLYLEYAELQALNRVPMTMRDWISKLDDFLKLSGRAVLIHAGTISHEEALKKAHAVYEQFSKIRLTQVSRAETDFLAEPHESTQVIDHLEKQLKLSKSKKRG
jgi:hypothetical protein